MKRGFRIRFNYSQFQEPFLTPQFYEQSFDESCQAIKPVQAGATKGHEKKKIKISRRELYTEVDALEF